VFLDADVDVVDEHRAVGWLALLFLFFLETEVFDKALLLSLVIEGWLPLV
jgi:hypothetical protein